MTSMRRIVLWLLSTVTVVVLLFGYHTSTQGPESTEQAVVSSPTTGGTDDGTASGSTTSGSTGSSDSSGSSSAAGKSGTYTGSEAQTQWGIVQVKITVKNGKITAVSVPEYPSNNPRDTEINAYALPLLVKETLSAQDAKIDMISGATVTSGGYVQSLQSALDDAGLT